MPAVLLWLTLALLGLQVYPATSSTGAGAEPDEEQGLRPATICEDAQFVEALAKKEASMVFTTHPLASPLSPGDKMALRPEGLPDSLLAAVGRPAAAGSASSSPTLAARHGTAPAPRHAHLPSDADTLVLFNARDSAVVDEDEEAPAEQQHQSPGRRPLTVVVENSARDEVHPSIMHVRLGSDLVGGGCWLTGQQRPAEGNEGRVLGMNAAQL